MSGVKTRDSRSQIVMTKKQQVVLCVNVVLLFKRTGRWKFQRQGLSSGTDNDDVGRGLSIGRGLHCTRVWGVKHQKKQCHRNG